MKRTSLRTLLDAAALNGTLLGIAVSDKPDAPLFNIPALCPECGAGHPDGCWYRGCSRGVEPAPQAQHITLDGDTAASEPAPVEHVILPE